MQMPKRMLAWPFVLFLCTLQPLENLIVPFRCPLARLPTACFCHFVPRQAVNPNWQLASLLCLYSLLKRKVEEKGNLVGPFWRINFLAWNFQWPVVPPAPMSAFQLRIGK